MPFRILDAETAAALTERETGSTARARGEDTTASAELRAGLRTWSRRDEATSRAAGNFVEPGLGSEVPVLLLSLDEGRASPVPAESACATPAPVANAAPKPSVMAPAPSHADGRLVNRFPLA